jgi:hypothetical protein
MNARKWGVKLVEQKTAIWPASGEKPPYQVLFRGISVDAPDSAVFRWLCQLRIAPYSYDWIDNFGRPSPRQLIPGLEKLEVGTQFMKIFQVTRFKSNRFIELQFRSHRSTELFGNAVITYMCVSKTSDTTRLLVRLEMRYPWGRRGFALQLLFPFGDLIMMRKQLITLKNLAESSEDEVRSKRG